MAIDFPASPTVGQTYTYNGKTWEWTGQYWDSTDVSGAGGCYVDSIPPPSPSVGDMWYDTTTGKTYIWFDNVWSEMTGVPSVIDASTLTGTTLAPNVVNSSLTKVGTLTDLTVAGKVVVSGPTADVTIKGASAALAIEDRNGGPNYSALYRQGDVLRVYESTIGGSPLTVSAAQVTAVPTTKVLLQAGGLGNVEITSSDIGVNPGGSGQLWVNGRPARVLVNHSEPYEVINGGTIPPNTTANLFKLGDIPVRIGDTLIVRGNADLIPSAAGWVFVNFYLYSQGGGLLKQGREVFDSNLSWRRVMQMQPLHFTATGTENYQLYIQGKTLNGACACQSCAWSYEIYGTR